MHWKLKSAVTRCISLLPEPYDGCVYHALQRHAGALRRINPASRVNSAVDIWDRILAQGQSPDDKVFFEVGTGWIPVVPLVLWLMGAKRVITVDLRHHLQGDLLSECLLVWAKSPEALANRLGARLRPERLQHLLSLVDLSRSDALGALRLCNIDYRAPFDAAATGLRPGHIDYHISMTVLEHIPVVPLLNILREGSRLISETGLCVHRIDYSDHFSHSDRSITAINFLRFSEQDWRAHGGTGFSYVNRLRHDDFRVIFAKSGHIPLAVDPSIDSALLSDVRRGALALDRRFLGKTPETIATTGAWWTTRAKAIGQK